MLLPFDSVVQRSHTLLRSYGMYAYYEADTQIVVGLQQDIKHISSRTKQHEVWLIIMRLLSVLMSRTKSTSKGGSEV